MKRYILILFLLASPWLRAGSPPVMRGEDAMRQGLLLQHPRPEYPVNARENGATGNGEFELMFDYDTGRVREVRILKSTGHRSLDKSAIETFQKWQAKPHSLRAIRVPVGFAIS